MRQPPYFWTVRHRNGEKPVTQPRPRRANGRSAHRGTKLCNRVLWSLPWQSDPPEP
jgi:hypothetical protein